MKSVAGTRTLAFSRLLRLFQSQESPLPDPYQPEVQKVTTYSAGIVQLTDRCDNAKLSLDFISNPTVKNVFSSVGFGIF